MPVGIDGEVPVSGNRVRSGLLALLRFGGVLEIGSPAGCLLDVSATPIARPASDQGPDVEYGSSSYALRQGTDRGTDFRLVMSSHLEGNCFMRDANALCTASISCSLA